MQLIGRNAPQAKRIIIGLDARRWCKTTPYAQYNPKALFPDWLYDESRINDFLGLLNLKMLGYSLRQIKIAAGWRRPLIPATGYRNNLIDSKWSLSTAQEKSLQEAQERRRGPWIGRRGRSRRDGRKARPSRSAVARPGAECAAASRRCYRGGDAVTLHRAPQQGPERYRAVQARDRGAGREKTWHDDRFPDRFHLDPERTRISWTKTIFVSDWRSPWS